MYGFFIISGFLITMSWKRSKGRGDYLRKRILRIFPGFIAVSLFCALVVGPLSAVDGLHYWSDLWHLKGDFLFSTLTLGNPALPPVFQGVPIAGAVDGSLWTIPYEFGCYLIVAALGTLALLVGHLLPSRVRRVLPAVFFLGIYGLYSAHCAGHLIGWLGGMQFTNIIIAGHVFGGSVQPIGWPRLLTYFASGMCLYLYRDLIPLSRGLFLLSIVVLVGSCTVVRILPYTLPIFGSYALIYIAFSPILTRQWGGFGKNIDLSYGLYLYSFPIQQLLVLHWGRRLNPHEMFFISLTAASLLATLSWFLVERPCLSRKRPKIVK